LKQLLILILFLSFCIQLNGQIISGRIIDETTDMPLEFVSIGIIGTPQGSITDEKGSFNLEIKTSSLDSIVRISMIGYKPQTYTIKELLNKENIVKLKVEAIQIKEVVVKPGGKARKVGTYRYSKFGGCCGWGGDGFGKGHEIGTKINLGTLPVRIQSLHIRVFQQAFDSSLFRIHIRDVVKNLPNNELLHENIFIVITKKSGWVNIDLSKYNLVFKDEVAFTLEWAKVIGLNDKRLLYMDGSKQASANVLFNVKKNQGIIYTKWGVENKWKLKESLSPSIYLTVQ